MMVILFGIMALLCVAYYIICMLYAGIKSSFITFWLMMAVIFAIFAIIEHIKLKNAIFIIIYKIVKCMLAFGLAVIIILSGMVVRYMNEIPQEKLDYIIVLGAQVRGDRITKSLKQRLDSAYEYAIANNDTVIIVSGGRGPGENLTEAAAMERYLVQRGIDSSRIVKEDKSTSTKENLNYSKAIIKDDRDSVGIVTNGFHVFRAVKIAKKCGFSNVSGIAAPTNRILWMNYVVRECFALVKEVLVGNI